VASSYRVGDAVPVDNSESSSSDDEKENENEISTFTRRLRNELPVTARSAVRFPAAKALESIIHTIPSEPTLKQNTGPRATTGSRNFVMDNTMKNFDPANWKKVHVDQKSSSSKFPLMSNSHEVGKSESVFELPEMLSPILNSGSASQDTSKDNSGEQDTCPLDISACETRKIDVDAVSSVHSLQQAADYLSCITFKNQSSAVCELNPSSSSHNSVRVFKDVERVNAAGSDGDENCPKRRKRVSFAGNKVVNAVERLQQIKSKANIAEESEAVTLYLKGVRYTRLNVLGKGGSSCVYRVLSSHDSQLYAYKRVEVKGSSEDNEAVFDNYINEIELLKRLKGSSPYIIDLVDAEVNKEEMYIAIVMEAGEVDLAKVLSQKQKNSNQNFPWHVPIQPQVAAVYDNPQGQAPLSSSSSSSSSCEGREPLSPFFVRMVWQEMLEAVDHIHRNRIVHGERALLLRVCCFPNAPCVYVCVCLCVTHPQRFMVRRQEQRLLRTTSFQYFTFMGCNPSCPRSVSYQSRVYLLTMKTCCISTNTYSCPYTA
jgi:Protein kinase domain